MAPGPVERAKYPIVEDSDSHWFQLNVSGGARALENPGVNNAQDVDVRKAKIVIPTFAYFSKGSLDRETMRQRNIYKLGGDNSITATAPLAKCGANAASQMSVLASET
ncbi:hypothetical protein F5J12DRAFT_928581 [Pisolithus orientalis]|uniref:uncharacterized protein n=1 Tax=Pisolithus orientalis TaxID=936130 RepID=UPI002223EEB8|nr:uncharacterized protein F5J12DRAFT_928581 [Pisolithus orientalis]KAI6000427.1 hypothetical protein F5J12DRAFT_928581 [Pisolithus orientalis]